MLDKLTGKLQLDNDKPQVDKEALKTAVIETLRGIYDPEIPVNIYDLGLIYNIHIDDERHVKIDMTLTTPGCPVAQTFPMSVENAVADVPGVKAAEVELVWDPPWTTDVLSDEIKLQLGIL